MRDCRREPPRLRGDGGPDIGPVAELLHGADLAYFVNFGVAVARYGGYRMIRRRGLG